MGQQGAAVLQGQGWASPGAVEQQLPHTVPVHRTAVAASVEQGWDQHSHMHTVVLGLAFHVQAVLQLAKTVLVSVDPAAWQMPVQAACHMVFVVCSLAVPAGFAPAVQTAGHRRTAAEQGWRLVAFGHTVVVPSVGTVVVE